MLLQTQLKHKKQLRNKAKEVDQDYKNSEKTAVDKTQKRNSFRVFTTRISKS